MILDYEGDDPSKNRIVAWFHMQLAAIGTCLNADLPEAALAITYSGIDTFGFLTAPSTIQKTSHKTFEAWCEKYILPRVQPVEGGPIQAVDFYAARCGILHTSTPLSSLEERGEAHQICYHLDGRAGVAFTAVYRMPLVLIDIHNFVMAFRDGGIACITDINQDQTAFQAAYARSQNFLRWDKYVVSS